MSYISTKHSTNVQQIVVANEKRKTFLFTSSTLSTIQQFNESLYEHTRIKEHTDFRFAC